jgi:hypothetical protein
MNKILGLVLGLVVSACAVSQTGMRHPDQAKKIGAVVRKTATTASYCPEASAGAACLMNWKSALTYCEALGGHLPTAREYANSLLPLGTKILETNQVSGSPPDGYYEVECSNPKGAYDSFYMDHSGYQRPASDKENFLFWTSSVPPKHPEFAHVYYNEWGGGGGHPQDHRKDRLNAVQCMGENP